MNVSGIITLGLSTLLLGQAPAGGADALKSMQDSARLYQVLPGDRNEPLQLQDEPAFRLGRQGMGNVLEGAIFFWVDDLGRPDAAVQVYLRRTEDAPAGKWFHEFTSLATGLLRAQEEGKEIWSPSVPGVVVAPLADAPEPAATPALRGLQMRTLARSFKASRAVELRSSQKGWNELRMLPTPIARYGKPGSAVIDGALFAFVVGTDPEVFLFVEERRGPDGPRWHYALAPMSAWPLKASGPGGIAWELPYRPPVDRTQPLFARPYQLAKPATP
jgi:hypothetical protein